MENEEDKALARIKRAKLEEIMRKSKIKEETELFCRPVKMTDATFKIVIRDYPTVVVDFGPLGVVTVAWLLQS
jgi:hypothetical protein